MTYQSTKDMLFPNPMAMSGSQSGTSFLLDAASESIAFVFQVPSTGTIDAVGYCTGTVTTGATMDVRLETVSTANGDPTGTLWGTTTNGAQVIADANDNVYFLTVLTAGASVTKGDIIAAVIVNPVVSPGNLNFIGYGDGFANNFPYIDHFTAAWAKSNTSPIVAIRYNDGSYGHVGGCVSLSTAVVLSSNAVAFSNTSTPDEIGLRFSFPFPCKVDGCWIWLDLDAGADIVLYDSDGVTPLTTYTLDSDIRSTTAAGLFFIEFTAEFTLTASTFYRLIVKPTTGTNVTLLYFDVGTAAAMDAFPGGQNVHYTSAKDPSAEGSWTQTLTRRPWMGLQISALDDGASAGTNIFNIFD